MRRDNEGWKAMFDHQHKHDDRRYGAARHSTTVLWWSILRAARQALRPAPVTEAVVLVILDLEFCA